MCRKFHLLPLGRNRQPYAYIPLKSSALTTFELRRVVKVVLMLSVNSHGVCTRNKYYKNCDVSVFSILLVLGALNHMVSGSQLTLRQR